jgi:hypothetical protein
MSSDSATRGEEPMNPPGHLTAATVADYRARRLGPAQILALHDHADECGRCSEMLASATEFDWEDHIGEQDAVDLVAGSLARPGIEEHLAHCAECRNVVDDLRAFRGALSSEERSRRTGHRSWTGHRRWTLAAAAAVFAVAGASVWVARSHVAQLYLTPAPTLVSSLNDGPGTVGLTASGDVSGIEGLTSSTRQLLRAALDSGRLPEGPGALQAETGLRGTLRSPGKPEKSFAVVGPAGTREYSDRPVFRWLPLAGTDAYDVVVFDADLNEVARSGKVTRTEWQPARPLPRQRSLTWQVAAERHGKRTTAPRPPEPSPVFEIISEGAARSIEAARAVDPPSHLVLALLYAQEGMREEAVAEIRKLAASNPNSRLMESLERSAEAVR